MKGIPHRQKPSTSPARGPACTFREASKITLNAADLEKILKKNKAEVDRKGSCRLVLGRKDHSITRKDIPPQAIAVLEGLRRAGYQAYLVGGCIRDLLTGKKPKDFDVSTNATPEQVRRVFQNSRIIGRRFKICHVVFGREIIEVTTFRSNQEPKHESFKHQTSGTGMLVRDNIYGRTAEEDAARRDFTINAIYYDLKSSELIDYHAGLYDLRRGVIDMIGDPKRRYLEDPVRMIRALRFAAKLGFTISKRTSDPIRNMEHLLLQVSNARMFEEVNKLFLTGHGLQSYRILRKYGMFEILFAGLEQFLDNPSFDSFVEYALQSSDERCRDQKRNMPHFLYAVILWPKFQAEVSRLMALNDTMASPASVRELADLACPTVLREQNSVTAIPMGIAESIRSMWSLQLQFLNITDPDEVAAIASKQLFRGGFDIFRLRARFEPYLAPYVEFWEPYYERSAKTASERRQMLAQKDSRREQQEQQQIAEAPVERQAAPERAPRPAPQSSTGSNEVFADDSDAERQDRLARARAWRASMHLDP